MRCERLVAPEEWDDARGPSLVRWLTDNDLRFPGLGNAYAPPTGSVAGGVSYDHWVIFLGLQVIQIVPDEVHSAWHHAFMNGQDELGSVWQVIDSEWRKSFHTRHLGQHHHFIIRFYDEVIEVICRELIFGLAPFDLATAIEANPKLAYAYLQLAISQQKEGERERAISNFEKYLAFEPDEQSAQYARRCVQGLRSQ